ncbi:MAG: outer membrane protein assembly factor BamE [Pseudomonadales bacterium]|nr:outer membrane protein assembly factor BamE [Pseudomonadales bacterium]
MSKTLSLALAAALCATLLAGCAQYENRRGVEVTWEAKVTSQLQPGQSSRKDVLALLGPPSQVISLEEETVLYYLFEKSQGNGLILILYNRMQIDTHFDRAIFFFDDQDILTDYSTHIYEPDKG